MSAVVKAGVLEVTVVQAVGLDLLRSNTSLPRTRRKPAVVARVSVDGTTKCGQPAARSHNPVWYPARPPDDNASMRPCKSLGSTAAGAGVGGDGNSQGRDRGSNAIDSHTPVQRIRSWGRYAGGRRRAGGSRGGSGVGAGVDSGAGGSGSGGGSGGGSGDRGMLFEVREFYGPTRIVVDVLSGSGTGQGAVNGSTGGAVLGRCEARLAEALVRRGGGGGGGAGGDAAQAASGGFAKAKSDVGAATSGLGHGLPRNVQHYPVAPFSPIPEARTLTVDLRSHDFQGGEGNSTTPPPPPPPRPPQPPALLARSPPPPGVEVGLSDLNASPRSAADAQVLHVPAPTSTAAATTDTVAAFAPQCMSCLPGGGLLSSWRRRRAGGRPGSEDSLSAQSVADSGGTFAAEGVGGSCGGRGLGGKAKDRGVSWVSNKGANEQVAAAPAAKSKPRSALSLEEAEALALSDWGEGDAGMHSSKDVWKELVAVGKASSGKGGTGVGAALIGPAVRLRLRFVPLWDCFADTGRGDGLGALHAAARDGDASLVTSLVELWRSLSPGSQVLSLPCRRGLTPIQHCIEAGKETALRELLRAIDRDSLRLGTKEGQDSPLHTAIKAGEEGMLRMLLAATTRRRDMPSRALRGLSFNQGAPTNPMVDSTGSDGLTPLALAAKYGNEAMVRSLLEEGANASAGDESGMTPLAHAANAGNLLAVRTLLKAKAPGGTGSGVPGLRRSRLARMACAPCKTNEDGMGPVALAAASGADQVVSELVRAEVPYRTRDRDGRTPLHHAARYGHISVLRVLVAEMRKSKVAAVPVSGRGKGDAAGDGQPPPPPGEHNTMMMDGGPFKLSNLDLSGRTAHALALLHHHRQAAAFLEAAAAELEPPRQLKRKESCSSKRNPWGGSSGSGGTKGGHPPRSSIASPVWRLTHGSGSSASGQGSGTSSRPSPMSSAGLGSGGESMVGSEDISYEYCESDREGGE